MRWHEPMPASPVQRTSTTVGIVGGGPAGLMLSHLLGRSGINSIVVDDRSRLEIEQTIRAGILERTAYGCWSIPVSPTGSCNEGNEHEGIELAFGGGRSPDRLRRARRRLGLAVSADRCLHRSGVCPGP
jgi:hypothetical protein